ncbi:cytochrome b/b6 domain-containing protein [Novosphingobium sp. JCM 18896]|uniref:cytochrome b/b6 domain-containing protein n=1 Tax=Novosphingobium sp. JCM 18896 TaxID=2989731 RepID=UPI002223D4D3|nr:cytochrome b/b6 domain-containing protein [Novosphingobium sp. JCM 18896]MCW1429533.1 cytochrome b/b6 domain-containing protein [Novosphingobium sp. JCM 18896]
MVRISHWLIVAAVFALTLSGTNILTSHPRLYWGETGNVNDEPWLVIPIPASRRSVPTAYDFRLEDRNGWSRNLHFEAAWVLVLTGLVYGLWGFASGHFRRDLIPGRGDRNWRAFSATVAKYARHFLRKEPLPTDEIAYNPLQRVTYLVVIFLLFPAIIASGLAMSPYLAAAWPGLVEFFGGRQSARSFHFLLVSGLLGFAVVHVILVKVSGFSRLLRGMTIGHG